MTTNYYTYEKEKFTCLNCGWAGLGSEVTQGDMFGDGFEIECPKCFYRFNVLVLFPTIEETLEMGSEADKLHALATKSFREKWVASLLDDVNQLPDIGSDNIVFNLREIEEGREGYIEICYKDEVIWREIRAYEYYNRFIEIGKLLKLKYGNKMIDLTPPDYGLYLYGDSISSIGIIEDFRKTLRVNN